VSPLRGEKPQNRPLSKLNTGRFALRAMLPVTSTHYTYNRAGYTHKLSFFYLTGLLFGRRLQVTVRPMLWDRCLS